MSENHFIIEQVLHLPITGQVFEMCFTFGKVKWAIVHIMTK